MRSRPNNWSGWISHHAWSSRAKLLSTRRAAKRLGRRSAVPGASSIWYTTLTGFDPYSPFDIGERCSLTGLKVGRAAFLYVCTVIGFAKKEERVHPSPGIPAPHAARSLLEQLAAQTPDCHVVAVSRNRHLRIGR